MPQFYLKYFAIPETKGNGHEQVWAMSRDKNASIDPLRPSTKCVAVEKLLYSPQNSDGTRDFAVEKKLSDLEGLLAGVWPEFAAMPVEISEASRKILALFLATLYLRHPSQREAVTNTRQQILEKVEADFENLAPRSHLDYLVNGEPYQLGVEEFREYKNATDNDHHQAFVENIQSGAVPLAERLLKKRWTFIVADEPVFVTCDNPMSLRGPNYTDDKFGFGTPGMSVDFPISPHVLLRLDDGEGLRLCPLCKSPYTTDRPWAAFNSEMWTNASRFMFSPRDPYGVLEEMVDFWDFAKAQYKP